MIDVVTVVYDEKTEVLGRMLGAILAKDSNIAKFIVVDNRPVNRGFAKACNLGAREVTADVIGFLNPDVHIHATFGRQIEECLAAMPEVMACGMRYGKSDVMLEAWCVNRWICGACFFVRREWFEQLGGFDEQFVFGFEETDFIRRTEQSGREIAEIELPIDHESPEDDSLEVMVYKTYWLNVGWRLYKEKHGIRF